MNAKSLSGLLAAVVLSAGTVSSLAQQVQFRSGPAKLTAAADADARLAALNAALADKSATHILVQFSAPVSDADRGALLAAGVTLHNYLPDFAFFASVNRDALKPGAVAAVASIAAIDAINPIWKLHPLIATGAIPPYALMNAGKEPLSGIAAVNVQFHADAPMGLAAIKAVAAHGGTVAGQLMSLPVAVVHIPAANLPALAADDSVMWIEPVMPPMEPVSITGAVEAVAAAATAFNNSNRPRIQADLLQASPYNLDGTGVNVFVFDGGAARMTHQTFTAGGTAPTRVTILDGSPTASHATHVSGTIGGSGHGSAGNMHRGMAPNVDILSGSLTIAGCAGGAGGPWFLYNCLTDLENDYNNAVNHASVPADIANNSIGTNTETNGFPCSLQGDYGITDELIDEIVRGSLGRTLRIVWANGNERQGSRCDVEGLGDYASTAPPATAKNHVTVGALNSNDDSMTTFSSWGPTDDGRMKPDVSAPGCETGGDNTVTSSTSTSDTSYGGSCGTSMASPTVCGVGALILQDYRANFGGPDFRNSTLKTLLAHTAAELGNVGPDYQFGYGSVRAKDAVDFMRTEAFLEASVSQGQTFSRTIVAIAGQPLKVTIAWDDPPGTPNTTGAAALVNDLDLRLIAPDTTVHFPWTLNPAAPSDPAVRTVRNSRDNIEQVVVDNPAVGNWTIEVVGFNVPSGPQPFSLAGVDPALRIAPAGVIPTQLDPGEATNIDVNIIASGQTLVAGSPAIFSRIDAAPFTSTPLTFVSANTYRAAITGPLCGHRLDFYFSAAGSAFGTVTFPIDAPTGLLSITPTLNGPISVRIDDNFQTDQGWVVTNTPIPGTFSGDWQRGILFSPATPGAPAVDGDASGQCYVTGNNNTNTGDVDFGFATLTSPVIDASGVAGTLTYRRWFHRTSSTAGGDVFRTEISTNGGGSWSNLEVVGSGSGTINGSWQSASFPIPNPTNQFQVRFTVNDNSTNSTAVEGGVDAVKLEVRTCVDPPSCVADWDGNGQFTPADVAAYVNAWSSDLSNGTTLSDIDGDDIITPADVAAFVTFWSTAVNTGDC